MVMSTAATSPRSCFTENDGLSFDDFCKHVRAREPSGQYTSTDELRARFDKLDLDASGTVDRFEYEAGQILDALAAKADPFKLFALADTDNNHTIDSREFETALRALGILPTDTTSESIALAFAAIDDDGSGEIDWKELKLKLTPDAIGARKPVLAKLCAGRRSRALGSLTRLSVSATLGLDPFDSPPRA